MTPPFDERAIWADTDTRSAGRAWICFLIVAAIAVGAVAWWGW